jgi:hypothetical protein
MDTRDSASDRRLLLAGLGLAGAAALARVAKAGDLNPPPGPIGPTGASVATISTKISPFDSGRAEARRPITDCPSSQGAMFVISQPGAYYLTNNIDAQPGKVCVSIECDHVDLDGNGFTINGAQGMRSAISAGPPGLSRRCVEIYDTSFRQCSGGSCIELRSSSSCFVSDCLFDQCICPGDATGPGAVCRCGQGSEVCDCDVRDCEGASIAVGAGSNIEDCTCMGGTGGAYRCAAACCVDNCMVVAHSGVCCTCDDGCTVCDLECRSCTGGPSIVAGSQCVIECCLCQAGGGIVCLDDCTCDDCDVLQCTGTGLACGNRCSVSSFSWRQVSGPAVRGGASMSMDSCDISHCQDGIQCGDNSAVCNVTARSITGLPDGTGGIAIQCGSRCSVEDSDCRDCVTGLYCGASCSVERCAVTACAAGYFCGASCCVTDCEVTTCSGTGFHCDDGCCVTDCDARACTGVSFASGPRQSVSRCVCLDGGSHGFVLGAGSTLCDCDVSNCNGYGADCDDGCSVSECRMLSCWGTNCLARCVVTDNEFIACDGSGGGGGGGAISCRGFRCQIDDNTCSSCPIGIYIFGGAEGCCCDGNQISSPTVAGMVVDASVSSCLCTDNACTGVPGGAVPFAFGSTARGPVVDATGGGDISLLPGSSHHCANWVY